MPYEPSKEIVWLSRFPEIAGAPRGKEAKFPEGLSSEEDLQRFIAEIQGEEAGEESEAIESDAIRSCKAENPEVSERRGYGGSQRWFGSFWAKLAGCGSVSGSNMAAYYQIGIAPDGMDGDTPVYDYKKWMKLQKKMFSYMRPGFQGFPHMHLYIEKFQEYVADRGMKVSAESFRAEQWRNSDGAFALIQETICEGDPLALLILEHQEKSLEEETWHWMTITGFDREKRRILISNYGRRQWLSVDLVFDAHPENNVKMARFHIDP